MIYYSKLKQWEQLFDNRKVQSLREKLILNLDNEHSLIKLFLA